MELVIAFVAEYYCWILQGFSEPSNDDNILEVVAVLGASQMVRNFVQLALFLKS